MKISDPWLSGPSAQAVCMMLENAGHQAWFVGGCVRNALLGAPVTDLDISTDARPERVMALAQEVGFKAVPTGIEHGTITVIHGGEPFEITSFRRDVETDGRRAVVAFAETLEEDAQRRDFTMNALYANRSGDVRDPVGGITDLRQRHFRFIGKAETRIREDYLRILRFFRFFAWYGRDLDPDGLAACAELADGLATLSAERITSEILKLLSAPEPLRAVAAMEQSGVLSRVLPGATARVLGPYDQIGRRSNSIARLAALGGEADGLRLSRVDQRLFDTYRDAMARTESAGALGFRLGASVAKDVLALRAASLEQPLYPRDVIAAEAGAAAIFPVKAADLPNDLKGPEIGAALKLLTAFWIEKDFTPTKDELLARL